MRSRVKKRVKIILGIAVIVIFVGIALVTAIPPTLFENSPKNTPDCDLVADKVFSLINDDRHLFNVPSAQFDYPLASDSVSISSSYLPYIYVSKPWDRFDYFVVEKSEWTRRYYYSPQTFFDTWTNTDMNFRNNVRNRDYNRVGVGVTEDNRNYYIVILWK